MISVLYISSTNNIHDQRIIEALNSCFDVIHINDFDLKDPKSYEIIKGTFEVVVYSPLSAVVPWEILNFKSAYGLCMAYEINELKSTSRSTEVMQKNIRYSSLINVDNIYVKEVILSLFLVNCPITEIKYGCDLPIFLPKKKISPGIPNIICNRSWSEIHRNHDAIKALDMLNRDGTDFRSFFLSVPENLKNTLNSYPSLMNSGKVEFFSQLSQEEMSMKLAKSHIYVSASSSDGTSISLLEAMANGKIVITTDFPANLEVISPGVNGFVFRNYDPFDLYIKLKQVINLSKREILKISKCAQEYALNHGNWSKESAKLTHAVNELARIGKSHE